MYIGGLIMKKRTILTIIITAVATISAIIATLFLIKTPVSFSILRDPDLDDEDEEIDNEIFDEEDDDEEDDDEGNEDEV